MYEDVMDPSLKISPIVLPSLHHTKHTTALLHVDGERISVPHKDTQLFKVQGQPGV